IFSFYLMIVIYLVGGYLLDGIEWFHPLLADGTTRSETSFLTPLHPFLALKVIFNDPAYQPPELTSLAESWRSWPLGWMMSRPHTFYVSLMFFLSFVLVTPSILLLRRVAQSTLSFKNWLLQKLHI